MMLLLWQFKILLTVADLTRNIFLQTLHLCKIANFCLFSLGRNRKWCIKVKQCKLNHLSTHCETAVQTNRDFYFYFYFFPLHLSLCPQQQHTDLWERECCWQMAGMSQRLSIIAPPQLPLICHMETEAECRRCSFTARQHWASWDVAQLIVSTLVSLLLFFFPSSVVVILVL